MSTTQELAQELLDGIEELLPLARELADRLPAFRAYHLATFEGRDAGWLGSGFLVDTLRVLAEDEDEDTQAARYR